MLRKKWLVSTALILSLSPALSFAQAEVEDYSQPVNQSQDEGVSVSRHSYSSDETVSLPDRLQRVESKVEHLTEMNVSSRIEQMQQTIQELRGTIEKQAHELEQLTQKQKLFYDDINSRLAELKVAAPSAVATAETSAVEGATKASEKENDSSVVAVDNSPAKSPVKSTEEPKKKPEVAKASPVVASPAPVSGDQASYQQAFSLLKAKQYERALAQFKEYVIKYPQGRFAANANFWMGEIHYLKGRNSAAKKSFEAVVKNYPKDQKMPDALLKLAIIETDTGHKQKAEEMLVRIQKQYPGTTAARLAMIRAQELRLSMH